MRHTIMKKGGEGTVGKGGRQGGGRTMKIEG